MQANLQALLTVLITALVALASWGLAELRTYLKTKKSLSVLEGHKVRIETINLIADNVVRYLEQTNKIDPKDKTELKQLAMGMLPEALRTLGIEITYEETDRAIEAQVLTMNEGKIKFDELIEVSGTLQ